MVEPTHRSRQRTAVRSPTWTSVGFVRPHSAVGFFGSGRLIPESCLGRARRRIVAGRCLGGRRHRLVVGRCLGRRRHRLVAGPLPVRMLLAAAWQGRAGPQAKVLSAKAQPPSPSRAWTHPSTALESPPGTLIGSQPPNMLLGASWRGSGCRTDRKARVAHPPRDALRRRGHAAGLSVGRVSRIRTATVSPEPAVSPATTRIATLVSNRSTSTPTRTAPIANPRSRQKR